MASDTLFFAGTPQFMRIDSLVVRRPFGNYTRAVRRLARTSGTRSTAAWNTAGATPVDPDVVAPLPRTQRKLYLQLPSLDPRIRELARHIAGGETSPVLRSAAWSRITCARTYGYTLELPAVEPADPLAFFLFHRKKGHCEYFASAMAVMLRTLGIPSRVVTGFQSGIYNPISGSQLIRTSDAHSWVEAWLPRSRLDHVRSHAARSEPAHASPPGRGWASTPTRPTSSGRTGCSTTTWIASLQLASRVGESSRHVGWNWFDGPRLSFSAYWDASRGFLKRYGFVLLGLIVLAVPASFSGATDGAGGTRAAAC